MGAGLLPVTTTTAPWRRNLAVCAVGSFTTIVAMTMLIPYLPVFVADLGVRGQDSVLRWSGVTYGATFFTAALTAPLWGALGDRFGRKAMLVRASLGMAVVMSCMGLAQNVWQLLGLRLLTGLLGGYASGSTILVAAQTPRDRSAFALGVLSGGVLAGNIVGPLVGGIAPEAVGPRATFLVAGGLIFCAFLATVLLLREDRSDRVDRSTPEQSVSVLAAVRTAPGVLVLLGTASLLMFATMSVEPTITLYVAELTGRVSNAATGAGVVMALGAVGSIVSAPWLGRLADRVGHRRVVIASLTAAGILLLLQAAASSLLLLCVLRLAMGVALGGLLPAITAAIRHQVPDRMVGRVLGTSVSAQYVGQVTGPLTGGFVAAHWGLRAVFVATGVILLAVAAGNLLTHRARA